MKIAKTVTNKLDFLVYKSLESIFKEVHGDKYCYSSCVFTGINHRLYLVCKNHGLFRVTPVKHAEGIGCPTCNDELTQSVKQKIHIKRKASATLSITTHVDKQYKVSMDKFKTRKSLLDVTCKKHGTGKRTTEELIKSYACKGCYVDKLSQPTYRHNLRHGRDEPTILYLVYFPSLDLYKVGIVLVRVGLDRRFNKNSYPEYETIKLWMYHNGESAIKAEQDLLIKYKKYKYIGEPVIKVGNDELFTTNILKIKDII